jgi:hypothetical protein
MLHRTRPITIQVRDAETQQPIAGARIEIKNIEASATGVESGTTGADGIVRLQDSVHDAAIGVQATARGYLFEQTYIPGETVRGIPPAPLFGKDSPRPVAFTVELYAQPRPEVELVVPSCYRGTVKVSVKLTPEQTFPPGQRLFSFPVGANGEVEVTGPLFLKRAQPVDFGMRYADGLPLTRNAEKGEPGYWWLRHEGSYDYFFIGSRGDYNIVRSEAAHDSGRPARSGGGGRGGRGGGRHGGGMGGTP